MKTPGMQHAPRGFFLHKHANAPETLARVKKRLSQQTGTGVTKQFLGEPEALQHLPSSVKVLLASGLLPAAGLAVVLNLILPQHMD